MLFMGRLETKVIQTSSWGCCFRSKERARCERAPRFRLEDGGLGEHVFRELLAAGGGRWKPGTLSAEGSTL